MSGHSKISAGWAAQAATRVGNGIKNRFHALTAIIMMIALLLVIGLVAIVSSSMRALIEKLLHVIADTVSSHENQNSAISSLQDR